MYTLPRANASGRRGSRAVRGSGGQDRGGDGRATARRGKRAERVNTTTTFVRATTRYYLADNSVIEGHAVCPVFVWREAKDLAEDADLRHALELEARQHALQAFGARADVPKAIWLEEIWSEPLG